MIKVKFIFEDDEKRFENSINEFIADKKVVDIKHQIERGGMGIYASALIIYEEEKTK